MNQSLAKITSLTSSVDGPEPGVTPPPLRRALEQQRCSLYGAQARAGRIPRTDGQAAQQLALAEELQRLTDEAFRLADILDSAGL
jgi:hypothetical protein